MRLSLSIFILVFSQSIWASSSTTSPRWQDYHADAFELAAREGKFILLDLEAVWCHWCHVMDKETYQDPQVLALLEKNFISVKADHDKRPDLAERYRDWGWPATIVFAADGTEIVKRAGYIDPDAMRRMLTAIIDDPSPEAGQLSLPKQFIREAVLSEATRSKLLQRHIQAYDTELGGLAINQKFIDRDSVEWDLLLAKKGDKDAEKRVRQTLDAGTKLIDPAFGGAYQYSTNADWDHPHYEKIMKTQWGNLRVYSLACRQLESPRYCSAARSIAGYLQEFLSDSTTGAFYTSQDADLKQGSKSHAYFKLDRQQRLNQGLPRVDKHHYAAENGMAIEGLLALYAANGEKSYLQRAEQAAIWVLKNRRYYGGGFRHDKNDNAGPYLADTLYMGRAFLALYKASGDTRWLTLATRAADFMGKNFRHPQAGLVSAADNGTPVSPLPQLDQNIHAARFLLELTQSSQDQSALELARHTARFLYTPEIAESRLTEAGLLLIDSRYQAVLSGGSLGG